jgi:hypothetical protein
MASGDGDDGVVGKKTGFSVRVIDGAEAEYLNVHELDYENENGEEGRGSEKSGR